jgi:hypothetical protein
MYPPTFLARKSLKAARDAAAGRGWYRRRGDSGVARADGSGRVGVTATGSLHHRRVYLTGGGGPCEQAAGPTVGAVGRR